ncbi:MAG: fumarate reductase flavoprotein subunit [Gammaproteobacteria bacterium]|jgi:fumarate reductase flavoprotein subunit
MNIIYTDTLVIGGGLAGLRVAIAARQRGLDSIILSLVPAKRSHSCAAQGGMQASLASANKSAGDNEDIHFTDTVRGSDWGADQEVVRMFTHVAPKAVRELANWGVPWNRIKQGDREAIINAQKVIINEQAGAHGLITARAFGGTNKWRCCYTSDGTGHAMLYSMDNMTISMGIPVHERKEALALIHHNDCCYGAVVRDLVSGELSAYLAKATTIATGGYGRLYSTSTNAVISDGIGSAIALATGKCPLGNMEAVQFHPTAIVPSGILTTEGCRGDGGLLRDVDGHRFMPDYEPDKAELASRDVVSRRMTEHMRMGKGAPSRYGDHLWLDITQLGKQHIDKKLREVKEICQYFLGIDPAREWIPVRPTQHYSMGGVRTSPKGESPGLKGLFAVGEAACWDIHGFNRLGGNSVAETVVSGMIVGEYVADHCMKSDMTIDTSVVTHFMQREQEKINQMINAEHGECAFQLKRTMQKVMMDNVGIFRNGPELEQAVEQLKNLLVRSRNIRVKNRVASANPELEQALRVPLMLKMALCVACGALARTESRGAHAREDFPQRDDANWLNRTLSFWRNDEDLLPSLEYEAIDIMAMELTPGYRGYGADNAIHHPNTALREQQIEKITGRMSKDNRFALQKSLMPFELPEKYAEKNQRYGVDYQ